MSKFRKSLRAVLWAAIGLGGRRADAEQRVDSGSLALILVLALTLVLTLIGGLIGLAHLAAG
ncbi:DUF2970 domain-containing protein [Variovorax ureilyticus]|uniref:DUF2970 domain-containing protein n=1 Tax=Variovorax ureilyticus TaxID=1836198 RepID=A0ABU8VHB3_9BURK